jgi:glucose/arabinose dehydrogenase
VIPQWKGDLFVGALRGERLWRIELNDDGTFKAKSIVDEAKGYGRIRGVVMAPDGSLWFMTSNKDGLHSPKDGDDRIIRLGPKK